MPAPHERADRESRIWDAQGLRRGRYDSILAHADRGPARARRNRFIGSVVADLADKTVLEIGSQAWASVLHMYDVRPKALICINISQTELEKGKKAAEAIGFDADFRLMDAHKLKFADEHFDFVYGVAILHHLDFVTSIREIARVTKPGGRILFVEPLRLNPIAQLVRLLTPRARTPDERPLGRKELQVIDEYFVTDHLFTELFHAPAAIFSRFIFAEPVNPLTRTFDAIDRALLMALPSLGMLYRTVTVYGHRRAEEARRDSR